MMLKRLSTMAVLALILGACAMPPKRVALSPETKQGLESVQALNILAQDEIVVRAEAYGASAAMGGGLIGAIIDSKVAESRQNDLQASLAPFYASVDDFNFRPRFEAVIASTLASGMPVKFGPLQRSALPLTQDETVNRAKALQAGMGQLFVNTAYSFTPDFSRIDVMTRAEIRVPGSEAPVYLNTFQYQSRPQGAGGAASIMAWSANGGAAYRGTLDEAAREIGRMLALDLAAGTADPADAPRVMLQKVGSPVNLPISGSVLAASADRRIVRHTDGTLYSLAQ